MYINALVSAIVLLSMALGLSYTVLHFRQATRVDEGVDRATVYAELGVRHALSFTEQSPNWRELLTSGPWLQDIPAGQATYSLTGIDPVDGELSDNPEDPVTLTCTATIDGISRTVQVTAEQQSCELLEYAAVSGANMIITDDADVDGDITSNANISKKIDWCFISGNAEAVGTIEHATDIGGTVSEGIDPKLFPDDMTILNTYLPNAENIPFDPTLQRFMLTPESSPYGNTNADGLYAVNCANRKITIRDCRVIGTLILLQPGPGSVLTEGVIWQTARPDYPAIIIMDGEFTIATAAVLNEGALGFDINLPGEPGYGSSFDAFWTFIHGLVYSNTDLIVSYDTTVYGTVISAGQLTLRWNSNCEYDPAILETPPLGFRDTPLVSIAGTWRQVLPN